MIYMENIEMSVIWMEENAIELEIKAYTPIVTVSQTCYIDSDKLNENANEIISFSQAPHGICVIEFGVLAGNYSPAFSMKIERAGIDEKIRIEMNMEIDDNNERIHRAQFYIYCKLGEIEKFGRKMATLEKKKDGKIKLTEE